MPLVFRVMMADEDAPQLGSSALALGVRVPTDITADEQGRVHPNTGGMSVSPRLRDLPRHRLPKRFGVRLGLRGAKGNDKARVWRMGSGPFDATPLTSGLCLRPDSLAHGLIEPDAVMPLVAYEGALHGTRGHWVNVEVNIEEETLG